MKNENFRHDKEFLKNQTSPLRDYDWFLLNKELKFIHSLVIRKWKELLNKTSASEQEYHSFIEEYAGFFFNKEYFLFHVISKLRLGADFVTDFVLLRDEHSNGLQYEFIEIEKPDTNPYTKSGQPSARLSSAIQQIEDWKNWIAENRNQIKKLLPSYGMRFYTNPNFKFTIIIGNRKQKTINLEKRRSLSNSLQINIRSFDYLTTLLESHLFPYSKNQYSSEFGMLSENFGNGFANPFYKAYSDREWRNIIEASKGSSHFTTWNAETFLSMRSFNSLFDQFRIEYSNLNHD